MSSAGARWDSCSTPRRPISAQRTRWRLVVPEVGAVVVSGIVSESSPRILHEIEQLGAALRDLAPVMASLRDALIEEGYSRKEAVEGSFRVLDILLERAARRDESVDGPDRLT